MPVIIGDNCNGKGVNSIMLRPLQWGNTTAVENLVFRAPIQFSAFLMARPVCLPIKDDISFWVTLLIFKQKFNASFTNLWSPCHRRLVTVPQHFIPCLWCLQTPSLEHRDSCVTYVCMCKKESLPSWHWQCTGSHVYHESPTQQSLHWLLLGKHLHHSCTIMMGQSVLEN